MYAREKEWANIKIVLFVTFAASFQHAICSLIPGAFSGLMCLLCTHIFAVITTWMCSGAVFSISPYFWFFFVLFVFGLYYNGLLVGCWLWIRFRASAHKMLNLCFKQLFGRDLFLNSYSLFENVNERTRLMFRLMVCKQTTFHCINKISSTVRALDAIWT